MRGHHKRANIDREFSIQYRAPIIQQQKRKTDSDLQENTRFEGRYTEVFGVLYIEHPPRQKQNSLLNMTTRTSFVCSCLCIRVVLCCRLTEHLLQPTARHIQLGEELHTRVYILHGPGYSQNEKEVTTVCHPMIPARASSNISGRLRSNCNGALQLQPRLCRSFCFMAAVVVAGSESRGCHTHR